jgi:hypothetical protein
MDPVLIQPTSLNPMPQPPSPNIPALSSVRSTGTWAIVIGLLQLILTPILSALAYNQTSGDTLASAVIGGVIVGTIVAVAMIVPGIRLRRTTPENLLASNKYLVIILLVGLVIMVLSRVAGGGGGGLVNLILLVKTARSISELTRLRRAAAQTHL